MTITLQDFATGDTNYVGKFNSNNDVLEAAINALQELLGSAGAVTLSLSGVLEAMFGTTVAVVGANSYACSGSGTTLTVQGGYCYRPSLTQLLSKAGSTPLSFSGLAAATYYVVIDATGTPTRTSDPTEAVYSVVWTGSAFGTITRLANIAWGESDWLAAQASAALGASYTTLDARLEAGEAKAVAGGDLAQNTRSANTVFAGPTSGGAAAGLFRALVIADLAFAGAANGVATLDGAGKVPTSQLPAAVLGALEYQGAWDAAANSPSITTGSASSANKGYYYKVNAAGTTTVDGISVWSIGDWIVSNGTTWDKVDNTEEVFGASGPSHSAGAVPDPGASAGTTRYLREDGSWATVAGASGGTVTSVALAVPAEFSVSGGPVTGAGTFTVGKVDQTANLVYAAPASGVPGPPDFRALVYADLPAGVGPGKPRVHTVTYAASVTLDCSLYDVFDITLTGNINIDFSGGTDGQKIQVRLKQDAPGSRTVAWSANVSFGTDITLAGSTASTAADAKDRYGFEYDSAASKYAMIAFARGY